MNEVFFYIGIVAVVIFLLRLVYYWGFKKGMEYGMYCITNTVEKFFLSIGKKELYEIFLEFGFAENGGDPKKLHEKDKDNK